MGVVATLRKLEEDWASPRQAVHKGRKTAFAFACALRAAPDRPSLSAELPAELEEFWSAFEEARLFEDSDYGQWGLVLLGHGAAQARTDVFQDERSSDTRAGDLVVGEFLGDSDLLLVRCDASSHDFGNVVVAAPLDPRVDWPTVAVSLDEFLSRLAEAEGAKYWE